jgi:hypothetical protein
MEKIWYPAMNRWSDQTGTAHLLSDGETAKPLCGAKVYSLGGGFKNAADAGCRECLICKRAYSKVLKEMGKEVAREYVRRYRTEMAMVEAKNKKLFDHVMRYGI